MNIRDSTHDKELYESIGFIAESLPSAERGEYARLIWKLVASGNLTEVATVRRWLRDTGYKDA